MAFKFSISYVTNNKTLPTATIDKAKQVFKSRIVYLFLFIMAIGALVNLTSPSLYVKRNAFDNHEAATQYIQRAETNEKAGKPIIDGLKPPKQTDEERKAEFEKLTNWK